MDFIGILGNKCLFTNKLAFKFSIFLLTVRSPLVACG